MRIKNLIIMFLLSLSVGIVSCSKGEDGKDGEDGKNGGEGCGAGTKQIIGRGPIITKEINLKRIHGIDNRISANVTITEGPTQKITVTGHSNIIEKLFDQTVYSMWFIKPQDGWCFKNYQLSVKITVPYIKFIWSSGSGNIIVNDFLKDEGAFPVGKPSISVKSSGSGNIELNSLDKIKSLFVSSTGSGNITGNKDLKLLEELNVKMTGSGRLNFIKVKTKECGIASSGSGDSFIFVTDKLNAVLSGSGNINYKGNPAITKKVTGSGKITKTN